jgi:ABC-2 type transport system ATP-binding protein
MSDANRLDTGTGPILSLRNVSKRYGDFQATKEISLDIPRGSIYGFLGPNGAGKTTTIRSIMNIILPDTGEILFDGRPLDRARLDHIGYLPEERGLYRKMTCIEVLTFLGVLKSLGRKDARRRAGEWMERLELGDWADKKVDALSKGMQQKIQFAATFLFAPELVILDEPFSGLDPLNIELLRGVIREENAAGRTIIFSTHMLGEAERLCDSICLIEAGQKILDGTLDEVRQAYPLQSVRAAYASGGEPPADLAGISHRVLEEGVWRLTLDKGADTDALLEQLRSAGRLTLFAANRPTVDEIFLTAVRQRRASGEGVRA